MWEWRNKKLKTKDAIPETVTLTKSMSKWIIICLSMQVQGEFIDSNSNPNNSGQRTILCSVLESSQVSIAYISVLENIS